MSWNESLILSRSDAETLALILARRGAHLQLANVDEVLDLLQLADIVPDAQLPSDRVSSGAVITYANKDLEREERITLVHPARTEPLQGQVSMLSPVGAALLGRAVGDVVRISLPNGRATTAEILAIERPYCPVEEQQLC